MVHYDFLEVSSKYVQWFIRLFANRHTITGVCVSLLLSSNTKISTRTDLTELYYATLAAVFIWCAHVNQQGGQNSKSFISFSLQTLNIRPTFLLL